MDQCAFQNLLVRNLIWDGNLTDPDCDQKIENINGLDDSPIWITYLVISEVLARIAPVLLLIGLNIAIIR